MSQGSPTSCATQDALLQQACRTRAIAFMRRSRAQQDQRGGVTPVVFAFLRKHECLFAIASE